MRHSCKSFLPVALVSFAVMLWPTWLAAVAAGTCSPLPGHSYIYGLNPGRYTPSGFLPYVYRIDKASGVIECTYIDLDGSGGRGIAVFGNMMYYTTAYSNIVYAYSLAERGTQLPNAFTVNNAQGTVTALDALAYDGTYLAVSDYNAYTSGPNNDIFYYTLTGTFINQITLSGCSGNCDGLEIATIPGVFGGQQVLISNRGDDADPYDVYNHNGGSPIQSSFIVPGDRDTGIAWDGSYFYTYALSPVAGGSPPPPEFHKWDNVGTHVADILISGWPTGPVNFYAPAIEDLSIDYDELPVPLSSCAAAGSQSLLAVNGTDVVAYVPLASWTARFSGSGIPGVAVVNIEGNYLANPVVVGTGTDKIDSCASDSTLGQTVCTAYTNAVYLIQGNPPSSNKLQSQGMGLITFSGGDCTNCGVVMDPIRHQAVIGLSLNGTPGMFNGQPGFQFLDLTGPGAPSFEAPIVSPAGHISEAFVIDPLSDPPRLLSASENYMGVDLGNYEIANVLNTLTPIFYENPIGHGLGLDGPDASAEDCSSKIAITPMEDPFQDSMPVQLYLADLTQVTFPTLNTWTAPSQFYSLAGSNNLTAHGDNGPIAMAQGTTHEGVMGQEFPDAFGGNSITAFQLNVPYNASMPFAAWLTCNLGGNPLFQQGDDPHTVAAYQSPNGTHHSFAVIANGGQGSPNHATSLAVVDLDMMLLLSDNRTPHVCDVGTLPGSIVRFITLP
jgi:hypothetical protein